MVAPRARGLLIAASTAGGIRPASPLWREIRTGEHSSYIRQTRPDPNGKYSLRLTPAENYRAVVVRGLEDGQQSDPEFLTRALEHATAFDIGEGEAKALNLRFTEVR
jgi:hypothetical protein